MFKKNEIYSDETPNERQRTIESVAQLGEKKKFSNENQLDLEELLNRSRQLNSPKSLRCIDQRLEALPTKFPPATETAVFSCNLLNKNEPIEWKSLPKHLQHLELSGNFVQSLDGVERASERLQGLGLSFNNVASLDQIFSLPKWTNLYLIDLSYNLLNDLKATIQSVANLNQLRILYLHGNPLSLIVDYRLYVIDSLPKLLILDDMTVTREERFRARQFADPAQHPQDHAQFTITFSNMINVPPPPSTQEEWPLRIHRYRMRLDWFDGEKEPTNVSEDKFANFTRFNSSHIETAHSDYKPTIEFSPNQLRYSINTLTPFRDFLFRGTTCRFVHQLTEYWQPGDPNEDKSPKKKGNQAPEKKTEPPPKKKRTEDLSKLVIRTDPVETILAEFHVELRSLLDGDFQVLSPYKYLIPENIYPIIELPPPAKPSKHKDAKKTEPPKDKKPEKPKAPPTETTPQPFQCSVQFQLHRYVAHEQLI